MYMFNIRYAMIIRNHLTNKRTMTLLHLYPGLVNCLPLSLLLHYADNGPRTMDTGLWIPDQGYLCMQASGYQYNLVQV